MIADAISWQHEDAQHEQRLIARQALEAYAYNIRAVLNGNQVIRSTNTSTSTSTSTSSSLNIHLTTSDRTTIESALSSLLTWLASTDESTVTCDDYEQQQATLERICRPIMLSLFGDEQVPDVASGRDHEHVQRQATAPLQVM